MGNEILKKSKHYQNRCTSSFGGRKGNGMKRVEVFSHWKRKERKETPIIVGYWSVPYNIQYTMENGETWNFMRWDVENVEHACLFLCVWGEGYVLFLGNNESVLFFIILRLFGLWLFSCSPVFLFSCSHTLEKGMSPFTNVFQQVDHTLSCFFFYVKKTLKKRNPTYVFLLTKSVITCIGWW